jgi:hypothetical protein
VGLGPAVRDEDDRHEHDHVAGVDDPFVGAVGAAETSGSGSVLSDAQLMRRYRRKGAKI